MKHKWWVKAINLYDFKLKIDVCRIFFIEIDSIFEIYDARSEILME